MSVVVDRHAFVLPRSGAPDVEIFAIGDIHGRTDLLAALLEEAAREPRRAPRRAIVFFGDLIDRGPDCLGAIDLAIGAGTRIGADETIALMGNHETMMRLAVDPATAREDAIDALETWVVNGGDRFVAEFVDLDAAPADADALLSAIRAALPPRVAAMARTLAAVLALGRNPVRPRRRQSARRSRCLSRRRRGIRRSAGSTRTGIGRGCAGPSSIMRRALRAGAASSSCTATRPTTPARTLRTPIRSSNFRLNLDAGSGLTGVAEMAIIRGDRAEVVAARGPTNRMLGL